MSDPVQVNREVTIFEIMNIIRKSIFVLIGIFLLNDFNALQEHQYPKQVLLILTHELLERFTFYGIQSKLFC
jgi:hypothetical protein